MYIPQFPYKGNQLILTSDRVMLHSKNDAVFIFGKQAVSLSSPQTINLDASQKVLIDSPKIELGRKAEVDGEPIILGNKLNDTLNLLSIALSQVAVQLSQASTTDPGATAQSIVNAGQVLYNAASDLNAICATKDLLSKNSFTK